MLWKATHKAKGNGEHRSPCAQITGYVSVCAQVWLSLFLAQCMVSKATHASVPTGSGSRGSAKQAQVQSDKYTFL